VYHLLLGNPIVLPKLHLSNGQYERAQMSFVGMWQKSLKQKWQNWRGSLEQ
jgi:hypothetical protein